LPQEACLSPCLPGCQAVYFGGPAKKTHQ
jgi:hypothetical protein